MNILPHYTARLLISLAALRRHCWRFAGFCCMAVGLYGAIAWLGPMPQWIDRMPGAPLVFGGALGLLLAGVALLWRDGGTTARAGRQIIAALLIAIGAAVQLDYLFGLDLGLAFQSLHLTAGSVKIADSLQPGRMPWTVALAFLCAGVALLLIEHHAHRRFISVAEAAAIAPGLLGALALMRYLMQYDDAYVNVYSVSPPMAVLMAISLIMLSVGLWAAAAGKRNTALEQAEPEDERIVRAAAFVMIPIVVLAGFGGFDASRNLVERAMRDALVQTLNENAQHMQSLFNEHLARAALVAARPAIVDALRHAEDSGRIGAAPAQLMREAEALYNSGFVAARFEAGDGTVLAGAGSFAPDVRHAALINQTPESLLFWEEGFRIRTRMPVMAGNDTAGYLLLEQPLPTLTSLALGLNATDRTGEMLLAFHEGDVLYNFPSRFSYEPRTVPAWSYLSVSHAVTGRSGQLKTRDYRGEEVLSAFGAVGDTGLGIVVKINVEEFFAPIARQLRLWVVVLAVGVIAALLLLRMLVRPLAVRLVRSEEAARQASDVLRETHARLECGLASLSARNDEMATVIRMSRGLQGCSAASRVCEVVSQFGPELFPDEAATLYLTRPEGLLPFCSWGGGVELSERDDACSIKGLCRESAGCNVRENLVCKRLTDPVGGETLTLCIPLSARDRVLGILLIQVVADPDRELLDARRNLAIIVAEHIGLALDNLQLRDKLRDDSLRDPLTGLYNRRYLEEAYRQAEANAQRHGQSLALMLIDMDHFKQLNDTYGHDAGDAVLRTFGEMLRTSVREGDTACRLGGEEFAVLMPNVTPEQAYARAEQVLQDLARIRVEHQGREIGALTASIGLAAYPGCGNTLRELLVAADEMLYLAKHDGRNRICVASCIESSPVNEHGSTA